MGEHKVTWRAVFLDRDGVLNRAVVRNNLPYSPETLAELEILPGVAEACRLLKAAGFLLIVATNQPDVGRGKQSQVVIERMHDWLQRQLPLDRVEVCYHSGVVPCECRKPLPRENRNLAARNWPDIGCPSMSWSRRPAAG